MEALVNLLAQYFGIDLAVLFAAINAQQASEDNRVVNDNVALDSSDAADDESNEYVNGFYVGDNDDNDHDESNEYVNGVYVGDSDNDHDDLNEYAKAGTSVQDMFVLAPVTPRYLTTVMSNIDSSLMAQN